MKLTDITDYLGFTNTRANAPVEPSIPYKDVEDLGERKVLFAWETTNIPDQKSFEIPKFNRSFVVIGLFVLLLFLLMKEFLLIAALGSMFFLWNILSGVSPEKVSHEITTHGINYAGQFFKWTELKEFYFSKLSGIDTLNVNTRSPVPGRLVLLINALDKERIFNIMEKYLTFLKVEPTSMFDKAYNSVIEKVSLDGE